MDDEELCRAVNARAREMLDMADSLEQLQKAAAESFERQFEKWREKYSPGMEMEIARGLAWFFFMRGGVFASHRMVDDLERMAQSVQMYEGLRFPEAPPPRVRERSSS